MLTNQTYKILNSKENHKEKDNLEWEKIFANYTSNRSLISLVYK